MPKLLGSIVGLTLAMTGLAQADVQKCVMQSGASIQHGWIAPEIYVSYDAATKKIEVFDGIISAFNKEKPIGATINSEKDISRTFGWSLFLINGAGQRTKMQYQASLFLATGKLHVTARPIGYRDVFSAIGACKPFQG